MNTSIKEIFWCLVWGAVLIIIIFALLALASGCVRGGAALAEKSGAEARTLNIGGQERDEQSAFEITVAPGRVTIRSQSALVASTQPSGASESIGPRETITTQQPSVWGGGDLLSIGKAKLGELASVKITPDKAWLGLPVAGVLGICGVVAWWVLRQRVAAIVAWALSILAIWQPTLLVWVAVAVVAFVLWKARSVIQQLVAGADRAIAVGGSQTKLVMEAAQDEATKAAVRAAKGKA